MNAPIAGTTRDPYKKFRANIRVSDGVGPILQEVLFIAQSCSYTETTVSN